MRELLIGGEFPPGERIREVSLAARLGVSRTPLRLVLERLEHEGLLQAREKGGFVAREFTVQDILDVIETRGVLEGTAARLAAERLESGEELVPMLECLAEIDELLANRIPDITPVTAYLPLNERFHHLLIELAKSPILRRSLDQVLGLPFASPNAFVGSEIGEAAWYDKLLIAQAQHRAIAEAIAGREGARAEAIAREHSRAGRRGILRALRERKIAELPGGPLVRIPEAIAKRACGAAGEPPARLGRARSPVPT
jgi:GntR family transcriptional regulator of vanillate catabolism